MTSQTPKDPAVELADCPSPTSATLVERRQLYQGAVFDFVSDRIRLRGEQKVITRDYVAHPGAVAIVALRGNPKATLKANQLDAEPKRLDHRLQDLEVLLINQYRHPVKARLWEIPAGLLDHPHEDRLSAAQRELWEETGYQADTWQVLADFFTSPGCTSEHLRIYLARDLSEVKGQSFAREDEEQHLLSAWVPLPQAMQAIKAGQIHSPSAVLGLQATWLAGLEDWQGLRDENAPFHADPQDLVK